MRHASIVRERVRLAGAFLVAGLLLTGFALGFPAVRDARAGGIHAATALTAVALALVSHVRRGTGADFLAAVALIAVVALGFGIQGGAGTTGLHLAVAAPSVAVSAWLLIGRRHAGDRVSGRRDRPDSEATTA